MTLDRSEADGGGRARPRRRFPTPTPTPERARQLAVLGLTAVLAVPVVVALVALHDPRWFPLVDMAQIEMRVRDVPTGHPPLLGLGGRIRGFDETGAHPGPLSFYLLWPVYWLLGGSAWGLQVSSAVLSLVGVGAAVGIARRRGGLPFAVATTAALAVLLHAYGAVMVTEPWNPRLPVLWWIVLVLAVWSVLCRDLALLPVAVAVGTYCMQTHIPYVALVGGLWLLMLGSVVHQARTAGPGPVRRPAAIAAGLLAVLWGPPLFEQFTRVPGNLSIIIENFRHPYDDGHPFGDGLDLWLRHLDVVHLVRGNPNFMGSPGRGAVFLALWASGAGLAVRRRHRDLAMLHLVVGLALGLGLVAITRVFGPFWPYLMYWAWGTTVLALLALVWTVLVATVPAGPGDAEAGGTGTGDAEADPAGGAAAADHAGRTSLDLRRPGPVTAAAGLVLVAATTALTLDAPDTEMEGAEISDELAVLAEGAVEFLEGDPVGCGDDCMYMVTWTDSDSIGSSGYGLLLELERQGFDARAPVFEAPAVRLHRTATRDQVDAELHVAVGDPVVGTMLRRDDARLVALADPHTPQERAEYLRLRRQLVAQLEADGQPELAEQVARQVRIQPDARMSDDAMVMAYYANQFERRSAVFLVDSEESLHDPEPPDIPDEPLGARPDTG